MRFGSVAAMLLSLSSLAAGQTDFEVTGTPIPASLLRQNYGSVPKGIGAFDLNICNVAPTKQSLVSSKVYQVLASTSSSVQPIGRDIMLAVIVRSQTHNLTNILSAALTSTTGALTFLSASRYGLPAGADMAVALASLTGQQLLSRLDPILSAGQLEKFEGQVLEPALVLDAGSCVERTVFVTGAAHPKIKGQVKTDIDPVSFHIH